MNEEGISKEIAVNICENIRQENRLKRISISKWWCWGCQKDAKGDMTKMCMFNEGKFNGCSLINKRVNRNSKN